MSKYKQFENDEDQPIRPARTVSFKDVDLHADADDVQQGARSGSQLRFNSISSDTESKDDKAPSSPKSPEKKTVGNFTVFKNSDAESGPSVSVLDPGGDRFDAETDLEAAQQWVRFVVEHIVFRCFTILLILVDITVVITDLALERENQVPFEAISLAITTYFILEVLLRIFSKGLRAFFTNWVDVVDFVIVLLTFIMTVIDFALEQQAHVTAVRVGKIIVIGRMVRILLLIRFITERRHLSKATRHVVSQNKRRYQKDGFDLDLCYITERCIAMSFPSTGLMAFYRNPIKEVARFFDKKHAGHFKIYNLCRERSYDVSLFHGNVERILIDDHNVPTIKDLLYFAESSRNWLAADDRNIIAIHCKGGKGRTGTAICTYLVDSGLFKQAEDSLNYFGDRRTDKSVGKKYQGVETPSQSRYVGYFDIIKNKLDYKLPPTKRLKLLRVKLEGLNGVGVGDGSDFRFNIVMHREVVFGCDFQYRQNCEVEFDYTENSLTAEIFNNPPVLVDDVKIMFYSTSKLPIGYDNCPFYFWFHTGFIENNKLRIHRNDLDNPHKKKTWHAYGDKFAVELTFKEVNAVGEEIVTSQISPILV